MIATDFLTVEEAAEILRIGRTAAYEATRRWRATNGAEGIPVVKVGGTLRVPRRKIDELAGGVVAIPPRVVKQSDASEPRAGVHDGAEPDSSGDDTYQSRLPFSD